MLPIYLTIGLLYSLAIGAGRLSAAIGIPRVTGYLMVGLLSGPSLAGILGLPAFITILQIQTLKPAHDIILGIIVFTIGGSFRLENVRKIGPKLFRISFCEIALTAFLVGCGTFLIGASPLSAVFLAVIAITTAPAATQMVMREYQSEGPLTDTILPMIGINNLVAIIAFILLIHGGLSVGEQFWKMLVQVSAPLVLGGGMGVIIAVMDQRFTRQVDRQMLVMAAVAVTSGVAVLLSLSAILSTMIAGVVAVNVSPYSQRLIKELAVIDYPLYVFFFIMAGADFHLEFLPHMGFVGAAYVVARMIGKYFGCRLGARAADAGRTITIWLGPAMLAQAGLAIGLADILAREWPGSGKALQTVVLASVVVFEMIGPLLTRIALVNAGEVTVLNLLAQRSPVGYSEGLRQVLNHFKKACGISPGVGLKPPSEILVRHLMRPNVETLSHRAPFNEVLKALRNSRHDRLPVVDDQNELLGVIKYADIANTLFDPGLRNLVVADEIVTKNYLTLTPEDTMEKAMTTLKNHPHETCLLVVAEDNPRRLMGIVSHHEVLSTQAF